MLKILWVKQKTKVQKKGTHYCEHLNQQTMKTHANISNVFNYSRLL